MQHFEEKLRAPELRVNHWINSEPLALSELRDRVVLIDFWDYTCINCLHTLPYLKEWHRRYASLGLTLIGLHAPEFQFSKNSKLIEDAVQRFQLPYPIALDNDFQTWQRYANRAWPAKYLIDKDGYIRAFHRGEGAYTEFERLIQELLAEIHPHQTFPKTFAETFAEPARPLPHPRTPLPNKQHAQCKRATPELTPELYLGYKRGRFGNPEGNPASQPPKIIDYAPITTPLQPDTVYLEGAWFNQPEAVESANTDPARIHVRYRAAQVNLVVGCATEQAPITVTVRLNGQPLASADWGEDVALVDTESVILVGKPRMYNLANHPDFREGIITLEVSQPGLQAYAFTFVDCIPTIPDAQGL